MARTAVANRVATARNDSELYNDNFEAQPASFTAATTTAGRWIDGTAAGSTAGRGFGWATTPGAVTAAAEAAFDTSVFRSGTASMRLSCTNTSGAITVGTYAAAGVAQYQHFPIKANTAYVVTAWIKTNNAASNAAFIDFRQLNSSGGTITTLSSPKLSGTNDWTEEIITVTTNASAVFGVIFLRNSVAGNVSDVWFDDITVISAGIGRSAASGRVAA